MHPLLRRISFVPALLVLLAGCDSGGGDTTPPSVSITAPASNAVLQGTVIIRVSASDAEGVTRVELEVDGQPAQTLTTAPYEWSWETNTFSDGPHTLLARAYDAAGNVGSSALVQVTVQNPFYFTVNNTAPTAVDLWFGSFNAGLVPSGQSYVAEYAGNPGIVSYDAYASGRTTTGAIVGLELTWGEDINVSGRQTDGVTLFVSPVHSFLNLQNAGSVTLGPIMVNAGRPDQTIDNVLVPPDGFTYSLGYYAANANTEVRGYWPDGVTYTFWQQGIHFSFPFTNNQVVTLFNTALRTETDGVRIATRPLAALGRQIPQEASARPPIRGPYAHTRRTAAEAR